MDSSSLSTPFKQKYQTTAWGFYGQDSWRVTPKLTLSYGLRWDIFVPIRETQDRISSFDPNITNPATGTLGALTFWGKGSGRNGRRSLGNIYWKEFSPRFGFAYGLNAKTMIRGSYGLSSPAFYGAFGSGAALSLNGWNASVSPASLNNGVTPAFNWDQGFPAVPVVPNLDPSLLNGNGLSYVNPADVRPGRTQNASFGLQREIPGGIVVSADYVGNFTHGLLDTGLLQVNQLNPKYLSLGNLLLQDINSPQAVAAGIPIPYPGFSGSVAQALRPFPQYQGINQLDAPVGFNEYNSLQITAQKHTGSGLSLLASYSLSKELTNHGTFNGQGQSNTVLQHTGERTTYKQLASLDRPQILQISALYELPFGPGKRMASGASGVMKHLVGGWELALSQTYMAGTPVTISTSQGLPGGFGPIWADRVAGVPVKLTGCGDFDPRNPAKSHYLNVAAFADPAPFSFGNSRVLGNIRTCGYKNENFSVIKNFSISERVAFSFGVDFDNVFNRHNWVGLNTNIDNPSSFGQFGSLNLGINGSGATAGSGASDPREILIHAKISF